MLAYHDYIQHVWVRSMMLYDNETWAAKVEDLHSLDQAEMCNVLLGDSKYHVVV